MTLVRTLDLVALIAALTAAWLWFQASSNPIRRVNKDEELNSLDLNRIITALNRNLILNRRAALATAASAIAVAVKLLHDLLLLP